MNKEKLTNNNALYSLIPLDDFKAILGVDDRDDKIARFCLVTATFTIEQYCKRRLLRKKHSERIEYTGDLFLPLREYPVIQMSSELVTVKSGEVLDKKYYRIIPDSGTELDIPFYIELSPSVKYIRDLRFFNVRYTAGYSAGNVPGDLAAACLELAAWNMNRYKGRHIGFTGNVKGNGREGQHFETVMPLQVRELLEHYRRKTI